MIGDEVEYDLHSGFVRTVNEPLKLSHPIFFIICKIRIDIVIVGYRIRGAYIALHIILPAAVSEHTRVPYVSDAKVFEKTKGAGIKSRKPAASEKSGKYLIYYHYSSPSNLREISVLS